MIEPSQTNPIESGISKFLCIVAGQRTGTTALQSALASTGKFYNFREIFQTKTVTQPGHFIEYAKQRRLEVAEMATPEQAEAVARDYLAHLQNLSGAKIPLLDVKLNSWQVIRPFWGYSHQAPFFMNILRDQNCTFIFIRRRDLAEQIMSEHIARAANKWHGLVTSDIEKPIYLNVNQIRAHAELILQSERLLYYYFKNYSQIILIEYENLFSTESINPSLVSELGDRFGVKLPTRVIPHIKKNLYDKKYIVANYNDVVESLQIAIRQCGRPGIM